MKSPCPEIEMLAFYLYHGLSPEEVEEMEAHFVECASCRRLIALIVKSESAVPDPVMPHKALR